VPPEEKASRHLETGNVFRRQLQVRVRGGGGGVGAPKIKLAVEAETRTGFCDRPPQPYQWARRWPLAYRRLISSREDDDQAAEAVASSEPRKTDLVRRLRNACFREALALAQLDVESDAGIRRARSVRRESVARSARRSQRTGRRCPVLQSGPSNQPPCASSRFFDATTRPRSRRSRTGRRRTGSTESDVSLVERDHVQLTRARRGEQTQLAGRRLGKRRRLPRFRL